MLRTSSKRQEWLSANGFAKDPFLPEARRAEGDCLLRLTNDDNSLSSANETAFEAFPYYEEVVGTLESPGPRFIFALRGGGKTALCQKIFYQYTADFLSVGQKWAVLPVIYNDFNRVLENAQHQPANVRPRYHVEQIIRLIVRKLFELSIHPELPPEHQFKNIQNEYVKKLFVWYIETFGDFHSWELNRILGNIRGMDYFFDKEKLLKLGKQTLALGASFVGTPAERVVSFFNDLVSVEKFDKIDHQQISFYDLLNGLVLVCKHLNIDQILVLVDDVDEPQYYGEKEDYDPAFHLMHSLIAGPKLLGMPGLVLKFFLPIEMKATCLRVVRLDKFAERTITWQADDLRKVLSTRLQICLKDEFTHQNSLANICASDLKFDIDDLMVKFAAEYKNPRALIFLGNELLAEHLRVDDRSSDILIPRLTWEIACMRARETLGPPSTYS